MPNYATREDVYNRLSRRTLRARSHPGHIALHSISNQHRDNYRWFGIGPVRDMIVRGEPQTEYDSWWDIRIDNADHYHEINEALESVCQELSIPFRDLLAEAKANPKT